MTELITDNLPLLAGAPNGVHKLRELIFELAAHGKLVTASHDVKRVPLGEVAAFVMGQAPPGSECNKVGEGYVFVKTGEFGTLYPEVCEWTTKPLKFAKSGDVLICVVGATVGKLNLGIDCAIGRSVAAIRPASGLLTKYLYFALIPFTLKLRKQSRGSAQGVIGKAELSSVEIRLPSEGEQHRIVAKVDELMTLCDRLEARQADAKSAHNRLVYALLDSLTQACDATDFAASWERLAECFHTLFTTESSIDALKQALLQLAAMGKLIPQDSNDEPASDLLKQIEVKKQLLVTEGKLKKQKPLAVISKKEQPFNLPSNWKWAKIGDLTLSTEYGLSEKTADLSDGVPVLKMGDIQSGRVILGRQMKVSKATEGLPQLYLESEDLLYNRTNSTELVGKTGIFKGEENQYTFASYLIRIRCLKELFSPAYLNISMNTPLFRETQITPHLKQQCGQANVNGTIMKNMLISVPPFAEQHRIVAKVDQLMMLCDQLKTKLTQARLLNDQLSAVLVEQALRKGNNIADIAVNRERARTLLAAEIVQQLHCEKRMGRVKLQKVISLAEHAARLKEIQSEEERYAAGPHDPALMTQAVQGLRENEWFEELALDDGKRYEYRPLAQSGAHRPAYEALWSAEQRQQINELVELMRPWDTARCERVATLYSAWNDLLIEGREANEAAILQEVLHGWNESKLKYSEAQWRAELAEMYQHSFLIPTGFGNRTSGGKLTLPGFEPSI
jgi:type I restriction enzyme S subunit